MKHVIMKSLKILVPAGVRKWLLKWVERGNLNRSQGWYKSYLWTWRICVEDPFDRKGRKKAFREREAKGIRSIPVFLVSFNRLSYLQMAIERFEQMGLTNMVIIDNGSTYPPLLEYYQKLSYPVLTMDRNYGHRVMWECPELSKYREDFYILSDPDVVPIAECPTDFVEKMFYTLKKYPNLTKVGFSLKLDDLPEDGVLTKDVLQHEKQFQERYIKKENLYIASLDTTFALYPPDVVANQKMSFFCAMRTGYPYQARHIPWYKTKEMITDEDRFYSALNKFGTWDAVKQQEDKGVQPHGVQ